MPRGFFITGTDTGVGKTFASAVIMKALGLLGLTTGVMKPVETGCVREKGTLNPADGSFLKEIAGIPDPLSVVTPYAFEHPVAPLVASELASSEITISPITEAFALLSSKYDAVVVEGAGGLMVPIRADYFVSDLSRELGLPLIIVARPGLGTINHIMLTVACARSAGLKVAGIVLNNTRPPENSLAEKTNTELLNRICSAPVIGTLSYAPYADSDELRRIAASHLDLTELKKHL